MDDGEGESGYAENGDEDGDLREWRFSLEDVEDLQEEGSREIEPGSPRLEHAVFVVLGVLATLFAIFRALFA